jgi:hypothetical protein
MTLSYFLKALLRNISLSDKYSEPLLVTCFHVGIFLVLFFNPEDEGDMFLRNVGWLSM